MFRLSVLERSSRSAETLCLFAAPVSCAVAYASHHTAEHENNGLHVGSQLVCRRTRPVYGVLGGKLER